MLSFDQGLLIRALDLITSDAHQGMHGFRTKVQRRAWVTQRANALRLLTLVLTAGEFDFTSSIAIEIRAAFSEFVGSTCPRTLSLGSPLRRNGTKAGGEWVILLHGFAPDVFRVVRGW